VSPFLAGSWPGGLVTPEETPPVSYFHTFWLYLLVGKILPYLTPAQVYNALSYFHDLRDDTEQELLENTEEYGRAYVRERVGEAGYLRVT
jgi:hypothetical protein